MKCKNCEGEFTPKRKTAIFCSAKCRVYSSRGIKEKKSVPAATGEVEMTKEEKIESLRKLMSMPKPFVVEEKIEEEVPEDEITLVTEEEIPEEYIKKPGY